MENPFEILNERLKNIETLLLDIHKRLPNFTETSDDDKFLIIKEAANFLNLAAATMYGKVHKREIKYYKTGKRLYFSKLDLLEYIQSGRQKTYQEIATEVDLRILNHRRKTR